MAATDLAMDKGIDCFCFSSTTFQCCNLASGCLYFSKTSNIERDSAFSFAVTLVLMQTVSMAQLNVPLISSILIIQQIMKVTIFRH